MDSAPLNCRVCGEPARLHCSGCDSVFCLDHLERRFVMGYFYFCQECLDRQQAAAAKRTKRSRGPKPPEPGTAF